MDKEPGISIAAIADRRPPHYVAVSISGLTHLDTAEMYGSGAAEEWVAEAIEGRRDEVFLVSKVLPQNASRNGTIAACDRRLLGWQPIDWTATFYIGADAIRWRRRSLRSSKLKRTGKILSWGVSNFDVADLEEALSVAGEDNLALCDS